MLIIITILVNRGAIRWSRLAVNFRLMIKRIKINLEELTENISHDVA